jgi:hypothetical protein
MEWWNIGMLLVKAEKYHSIVNKTFKPIIPLLSPRRRFYEPEASIPLFQGGGKV